MNYSKYQQAVFNFAENENGNGAVEAVAGSGKSTTGIEMVTRFGPMYQGLFTSFTKVIVQELDERLKSRKITNVRAKTYNSFGAGLIYKNMRPAPKLLTDYANQKTDILLKYDVLRNADEKTYYKCKNAVIRLIGLFKALALKSETEMAVQYSQIVDYYGIETPKHPQFPEILLDTWRRSLTRFDIIDFDDQKFLPVLREWEVPQVDFLVVDEFQDSSPLESELMLMACRNGRKIVFGDRNQAIYSFKGTKPDSMQTFSDNFSAKSLPLSICYRCPRAVIAEAQKIVPHIEAADNAIEGTVDNIQAEEYMARVTDRDMILGRVTDDLVRSVTRFLAQGRGAYIEGREYGTLLIYFIDSLTENDSMDCGHFADLLDAHYNERSQELAKYWKESQLLILETKVECVRALLMGCSSVADLKSKIGHIFTDKGNGVKHLTIHKSKGLEGRSDGDVYILRPDKIPHPKSKFQNEEMRLKYVAITRSKRGLYYVLKSKEEK